MADVLSYRDLTLVPVPDAAGTTRFYMGATAVTQALWKDVMGVNLAATDAPRHPATRVSWDDVTGAGGFLERLNATATFPGRTFRLPSEAEWEYAARGGPHAPDGVAFSGSNDIDEIAWYGARFSPWRRLVCRVLGWERGWRLVSRPSNWGTTQVHDVALKKPNQLGLYDMTGNVWEWCADAHGSGERGLRGGCHSNWDIHCTNGFRYAQPSSMRGKDVGFRVVLA